MSDELKSSVPATVAQLPAIGKPDEFWGDMESSDFAIPSVTIGQGTSSKGVVGEFNFNNGSHAKSLVGVSLLVPSKTRTLFAGKGSRPVVGLITSTLLARATPTLSRKAVSLAMRRRGAGTMRTRGSYIVCSE